MEISIEGKVTREEKNNRGRRRRKRRKSSIKSKTRVPSLHTK